MQFGRAFTFIFEDRDWLPKLLIIFLLSALTVIPIIGFVPLAALLGYMTELTYYVRTGHPRPLPGWQHIGKTLERGGYVLLAFIVYNLPNILVACCFFAFWGTAGFGSLTQLLSGLTAVLVLCCAAPFLLIYNLIAYPFLGCGMIRYGETEQVEEFFRLAALGRMLTRDLPQTFEWASMMLIANLLLLVVPFVGWFAALFIWIPVQGHLVGQYAARLDALPEQGKEKPKRV